ncbi:MAG: AI-2E family transporter [bacterium]|nr:AI-2E family transporter [bacterium]
MTTSDDKKFSISWGSLWKVFFMLLIVAGAFVAMDILLALLAAVILSAGLNPIVSFLERWRIPRVVGTLLIFIFAIGVLATLLYAVIPIAIVEFASLFDHLGEIAGGIFGAQDSAQIVELIKRYLDQLSGVLTAGSTSLVAVASSFIGGIVTTLAVVVITFYLTVSRDGVERFIQAVLPLEYEDRVLNIVARANVKIGYWLQTQIFLSLMVGLATFLGLWLLGVKYALFLGILAALLEIIPFVGPIFAGSIAVLIALADSPMLAIYTLLLFVVIQQIESQLMVPVVMRRAIGVHPVVILMSLLLGAQLAGFLGLIIAVPTAVILQEFLDDWSLRKMRSGKRLV